MFQTRKPPRAGRPAWKCAEGFKRWLRQLPCAACGLDANSVRVVAAHVDHAGGKGVASKVADRHCIPLCDPCHIQQHAAGWLTFEKGLPGQSAPALATTYWERWPERLKWERENGEIGR